MPSQLKVIQGHIDDAATKGAKFVIGGVDSVKAPFVEPVIMVDVPENSTAVTEETFGPTLVINRTTDMAEAIRLANATRYGLAASVWSKRNGEKIAAQLQCGMVSVNSVIAFAAIASVPFGGVKGRKDCWNLLIQERLLRQYLTSRLFLHHLAELSSQINSLSLQSKLCIPKVLVKTSNAEHL
jgi:hypothetical protein